MPRQCCVPNCNANFDSTKSSANRNVQRSCFKFPTDESLKQEWLRRLPRKSFNTENTGVCILHFEEQYIKRYFINSTSRVRLEHGAVPTLFLPSEKPNEQAVDERVVDVEIEANSIEGFDSLKSDLTSMLRLDNWKVACSESNVHIYKLMTESNGNLTIQTSINVNSDLIMKIFHRDKPLGLKFSNHTVHRSLKLKEWSHLQKLIDKFSNVRDLNIHVEKIRYD